jgi:RHS repeat-associated protein
MGWKLAVSQTRLPPGALPAQEATLGTIPCNDSYIKLTFLRSRWYSPAAGRFTTHDEWPGDYNRPQSLNGWSYTEGDPINREDPSGYSPSVDCTQWDWYFRGLCQVSNGNDTDKSVLDARQKLLTFIAGGGFGKYWLSGGAYNKDARGYAWAATLLAHFLGGSGAKLLIALDANDPFVNDPGIVRATRALGQPASSDEADMIVPLLDDFLGNYLKPIAQASGGSFSAGPVLLYGKDHYINDPSKTLGLEPRARNQGYWAAFGHVTIDGEFSANGYFSCRQGGYLVSYFARYSIDDRYQWFPGKQTPFPFGQNGGTVWIPHEWEISLITAGRAAEFDFTISWGERERLLVAPDFAQYSQASWWMW